MKEALGFALFVVLTAIAAVGVPIDSWRISPLDPTHLAVISSVVVLVALFALRLKGGRPRQEQTIAAAFLAGMPLVYLASWAWAEPRDPVAWLGLEAIGVIIYVAFAVLGMRRSPWFLVIGIAAHGIAWDLWHHAHATYIPHWYATGCFIVDVAYASYVALCIPRWRAHAAARRARTAGPPLGATPLATP